MPDPRCWMCRNEMCPDSPERLALCEEHIKARIAEIMGRRGKPAQCADTYY